MKWRSDSMQKSTTTDTHTLVVVFALLKLYIGIKITPRYIGKLSYVLRILSIENQHVILHMAHVIRVDRS